MLLHASLNNTQLIVSPKDVVRTLVSANRVTA
jgi:hypothetical protein